MSAVLTFIHIVAAVLLIGVILMQSGRGGGLTEGFAPAESFFGAKTNQFMVRATIILTTTFLLTSLSLAYISARKESSIIPESAPASTAKKPVIPVTAEVPGVSTPAQPSEAQQPEPAAALPQSAPAQKTAPQGTARVPAPAQTSGE